MEFVIESVEEISPKHPIDPGPIGYTAF